MNLNTEKAWSDMDLWDLRNSLAHGQTAEAIADFLCRDIDEVREKMAELQLTETGTQETGARE